MESVLRIISDFGDTAVLLPFSMVLAALVWRFQSWAAARCLLLAFVFCSLTMLLLKVGFIACSPVWQVAIVSPSGHASFSATAYGALGVIAARQARGRQQTIIVLVCLAFIACIAVSRVSLGSHTPAEVGLGLIVGAGGLCLFAVTYLRQNPGRIDLALLFGLMAGVMLAFHGAHLPVEVWIRHLADAMRHVTGACLRD